MISQIDKSSSVTFRTGMMQYSYSSVISGSDANLKNAMLDYQKFLKKNLAITFAYRIALSEYAGRLLYQSALFGGRYYPWTLGVPIKSQTENIEIAYNFDLRPYVEYGGSFGNFLIQAIGEKQGTLISSEFVGVFLGFGTLYHISKLTAFDLSVQMESLQGISTVKLTAMNIYASLGFLIYL